MTDEQNKKTPAKAEEVKEPVAKAEPKPAAKAEPKPAAKAEPKPAAKAEPKPAAKAEKKSAAKAEKKSAAKGERSNKPAAKKASSKREPAEPAAPKEAMMVRATARYVRSSPRKARLVVDHIRGDKIEVARVKLQFIPRHVARDVAKVLESAVANAEHNHELDAEDLHVAIAYVDEGPTLKRWRPRARGRATQILKRTSHITVVVSNGTAKQDSEFSTRKAAA